MYNVRQPSKIRPELVMLHAYIITKNYTAYSREVPISWEGLEPF